MRDKRLVEFAKSMRREMTEPEKLLWHQLRAKREHVRAAWSVCSISTGIRRTDTRRAHFLPTRKARLAAGRQQLSRRACP